MPDYSKGLIYTIRTGNSLYVGSTSNFTKRKYRHGYCINKLNTQTKLYNAIRDNGGEWDMKPYKEYSCETKQQLNIEEERIKCELNADLNMYSCYGIDKEKRKKYLEENKEQIKKKHQEWCEKNIEKKREIRKRYREKKRKEKMENNYLGEK